MAKGNVSGRERTVAAREALNNSTGKSLLIARTVLSSLVRVAEDQYEKCDLMEQEIEDLKLDIKDLKHDLKVKTQEHDYMNTRYRKVVRDLENRLEREVKRANFYYKNYSEISETGPQNDAVVITRTSKDLS